MQAEQTRAIVAICLMAAFADQHKDEREREHIRQIAESLSADSGIDLMKVYQDVLLGRLSLDAAVSSLETPALRQLAFEMAVGVCDADGVHDARETAFLDTLRSALGLDRAGTDTFIAQADALASLPLDETPPSPTAAPAATPAAASGGLRSSTMSEAELDKTILNTSILNGALELLPQSLASMAIIPLQTRLVYRIGKSYGYELDRGHIKDFLATVGIGLTSQYVEQFGRKLVGNLLGKMLGKTARKIGSAATGSAFSFASTYALGQLARRYYAGGRSLSGDALKTAFSGLVTEAQGLQQRYTPQIEERARTLDVGKLMNELRV